MRPIPRSPRLLCLVAALGCVLAPLSARAAGDSAAADTRRLLALLAGIRGEYHEAFDAQGRVTRAIEVEEAKLLLAEARDLNTPLALVEPSALDAVAQDVDHHVPPGAVVPRLDALAAAITERTGIRDDPLPPEPPSPVTP